MSEAPIINMGGMPKKEEESTQSKDVLQEFNEEAAKPELKEVTPEPVSTRANEEKKETKIFALRTTANREDQVLEFVASNAARKKLPVYAAISPHGMRGYIFIEAADQLSAEQAAHGVPYSKGILPKEVEYKEIEHMLEQVKREINIQKNDIAEIISGAFKRDKAKITRVDKVKGEVVVELLESPVPIPITLPIDSVKVIRREDE